MGSEAGICLTKNSNKRNSNNKAIYGNSVCSLGFPGGSDGKESLYFSVLTNSILQVLLSPPSCKRGRLCNLPKVIQLQGGGAQSRQPDCRTCLLISHQVKRMGRNLKLLSNAISFLERGGVCVLTQLSFLFLYWLISGYVSITQSVFMETRHRDPEWTLGKKHQRQRVRAPWLTVRGCLCFPNCPFWGSLPSPALGAGHGAEC